MLDKEFREKFQSTERGHSHARYGRVKRQQRLIEIYSKIEDQRPEKPKTQVIRHDINKDLPNRVRGAARAIVLYLAVKTPCATPLSLGAFESALPFYEHLQFVPKEIALGSEMELTASRVAELALSKIAPYNFLPRYGQFTVVEALLPLEIEAIQITINMWFRIASKKKGEVFEDSCKTLQFLRNDLETVDIERGIVPLVCQSLDGKIQAIALYRKKSNF